ncbi:MAG: SpoIID/LytB domain-containing protein, partial [Chitinispirillia bacterium]
LQLNIQKAVIYSIGSLNIRSRNKFDNLTCKGRIALSLIKNQNGKTCVNLETSKINRQIIFLPCTLQTLSSQNFFELNESSYRGSIIISQGEGNTFSIINYCNVEEYLRGVVPSEIGKRSRKEIEAVKAQAIAARTYTYKRMIERQNRPFDMYSTIKDQVYMGIKMENPLCDRAILLTKGLVLAYENELVYCYYHSTCGGITADIRDVWNNKGNIPYLISVKDTDSTGKAYCSISNRFTWSESWKQNVLSSIINKYSKSINGNSISGSIKTIKIKDRFSCGRISKLLITTTTDTYTLGGDKIRFILRRNAKNNPILYSARFSVVEDNHGDIRIEGKGFGHGIGMCQMGAIGRALAGQSYKEILQVYYPGSHLANVKYNREVEYIKAMKP